MKKMVAIVAIVHGEEARIQPEFSDVELRVPKGVLGVILGNICTDPIKYLHLIPTHECLIAPICLFSIYPLLGGYSLPSDLTFQLKVPHIVKDLSQVKSHIRVRREDSLIPPANVAGSSPFYEIDENYIYVYTSNFSKVIVTAEGINCCSSRANISVFGSLDHFGEESKAIVHVFFSSMHNAIPDYQNVSFSSFSCKEQQVEINDT